MAAGVDSSLGVASARQLGGVVTAQVQYSRQLIQPLWLSPTHQTNHTYSRRHDPVRGGRRGK